MHALNQKYLHKQKLLCFLPQILLAISYLGITPLKVSASEMRRAEAGAIIFNSLQDGARGSTGSASGANPPTYLLDDLGDLDYDLVNTIKDLVIAAGSFELSTEELKAELNKLNSNLKYTLFSGKQRKDFTRNDYVEPHAQWVKLINSKFFVRKADFEVLEANQYPSQDQETQFELLPLLSIYIKLIGFCDDTNTQEKVTSIVSKP